LSYRSGQRDRPSNNRNFGILATRRPDPDLKRPYDIEYSLGITREVARGVSVTGAWYRRETYNLEQQLNTLVTASDFASFTAPSPLNGEPVTIYNLNRSKQGLVDLLDTTATDRAKARVSYNGLEVSFVARLPGGGNMIGGWSATDSSTVSCAGFDPNTFRYCDQGELGIPFRHDFKFAGSHPLPLDFQIGATLQSYAGLPLAANWAVPANLFPGGRTQAVTVNLVPPAASTSTGGISST
jgi:hypothetical protein